MSDPSDPLAPSAPSAVAHLVWAKGGTASLLAIAQDNVVLRSTVPSPPGARMEATLATDPSVSMKIKIHGSKLQPDGTFTLKGRVLEATRALRDRLTALVPAAPPA